MNTQMCASQVARGSSAAQNDLTCQIGQSYVSREIANGIIRNEACINSRIKPVRKNEIQGANLNMWLTLLLVGSMLVLNQGLGPPRLMLT